MSDLVFERGLYATLAAALIIPELTTFVLFLFVLLMITTFFARQAWLLILVPTRYSIGEFPARPVDHPTLHVVSADGSAIDG